MDDHRQLLWAIMILAATADLAIVATLIWAAWRER
jgi:hypothetical protein